MFRILVSDKLGQPGIDQLEQDQSCEFDIKTDLTPEQLVETIPAYDGLIIRSGTQVTADVLQAGLHTQVYSYIAKPSV